MYVYMYVGSEDVAVEVDCLVCKVVGVKWPSTRYIAHVWYITSPHLLHYPRPVSSTTTSSPACTGSLLTLDRPNTPKHPGIDPVGQ